MIEEELSKLVWDYCWHCTAWHCVCPIKGCNSCACGCPHGLYDDKNGCKPWWDLLNTDEFSKIEKKWIRKRPTLQKVIDRINRLNSIEKDEYFWINDRSPEKIVSELVYHGVSFKFEFNSEQDYHIEILDEKSLEKSIEEDNKYIGTYYPLNIV